MKIDGYRDYFQSINAPQKSGQKRFGDSKWSMPKRPPSASPMHYYAYLQFMGQDIQMLANVLHQLREHPELANESFFQHSFLGAITGYYSGMSIINSPSSDLTNEERRKLQNMGKNFEDLVLNISIPGGSSFSQIRSYEDKEALAKTLSLLVQKSEPLNSLDKNCTTFASEMLGDAASVNKPTQAGINAARKIANAISKLKERMLDPTCRSDKDKKKQLAEAVLNLYYTYTDAIEVPGEEGTFLGNMWIVICMQVMFSSTPSSTEHLYSAAFDVVNKGDFSALDRLFQVFDEDPFTFQYIFIEDLSQALDQYTKYGV